MQLLLCGRSWRYALCMTDTPDTKASLYPVMAY